MIVYHYIISDKPFQLLSLPEYKGYRLFMRTISLLK